MTVGNYRRPAERSSSGIRPAITGGYGVAFAGAVAVPVVAVGGLVVVEVLPLVPVVDVVVVGAGVVTVFAGVVTVVVGFVTVVC